MEDSRAGAPLVEDVALVTVLRCGHWWVYRMPVQAEHLYELARFARTISCSFCLADRHAATGSVQWSASLHVN